MHYEMISSLQNPQVKVWRTLTKSRAARKKFGLFLAEGEHMTAEAIQEKKATALIVNQALLDKYEPLIAASDCASVYLVNDAITEALSDAKTPQGIAALCEYPADRVCPVGNRLVALEGVQDPGNVGTILRSMDASGFESLLVDAKTADPYGPKALRASMGSVFRIPVIQCVDIVTMMDTLKVVDFAIVAGDLKGDPLFARPALGEKVCLLIGNEGAGLSPEILEKATQRVKIPMIGKAESLNAAVAASILMYDALRERSVKEQYSDID